MKSNHSVTSKNYSMLDEAYKFFKWRVSIMYNCKRCKTEVTKEHRSHICVIGKIAYTVIYNPNIPKPNKQSMVPDYMKRFGSRSNKS